MNYRTLGKTKLNVSEVGFGGIPIQRVTQEDVNNIVKELINQEINFIDTAKGYTVSETYIGNALVENREKFIIATKSMARDYEQMKKDIDDSIIKLKCDYIDLYQCHNVKTAEEYNAIMSENGAYKALLEAKAVGKIKHIGITSHICDFLLSIIDNCVFETIQFPYNIIENQAEELFKKAKQNDIGVICMKPMAGGAIDKGNIAIKYILNNENITVAIPGMDSVNQVIENANASKDTILNFEEIEYCEKLRKELGNNFCRRCGYCTPCSVGIDIPFVFTIEGYYNRYNLKEWAVSRYHSLTKNASDCIKCGKCEKKCPYNLPIIQKLSAVDNTFKNL